MIGLYPLTLYKINECLVDRLKLFQEQPIYNRDLKLRSKQLVVKKTYKDRSSRDRIETISKW